MARAFAERRGIGKGGVVSVIACQNKQKGNKPVSYPALFCDLSRKVVDRRSRWRRVGPEIEMSHAMLARGFIISGFRYYYHGLAGD